jgi:hypothetical protein
MEIFYVLHLVLMVVALDKLILWVLEPHFLTLYNTGSNPKGKTPLTRIGDNIRLHGG